MSQRIDGPGIMPDHARMRDTQGIAQTGSFMGEAVKAEMSTASLIADAAEELTFSASEDVERKLSERKEGKDKTRNLEQILLYVEKSEDLNREDLEAFFGQLKSLQNATSAGMVSLVKQAFKDPTNQHAALSYCLAKLEESDLSPAGKQSLRNATLGAIGSLEAESGRAINAGYNVAGIDAPGLDLVPSSLRVLYRDTVIDFQSYETTFGLMLEKFGPQEFSKAVDYLIRALGNDMAAITPSSPKAALKEVMDGLYMVESLGTIYKDAHALLAGSIERHGPNRIAEKSVIEPLLRYKDMPMVVAAQVGSDMSFLISDNAVRDAELTQGVRELARKMPHKLYASNEARQNVLNALQELLDNAVDREEMEMEE